MAINIDTLVHNEFGRSASDQLEKLTGKSAGQVRSGVDRAITEVLDGFSIKAQDEAGRQALYEAARYCDDGLIDDPSIFFGAKDAQTALADSNNALGALLGSDKRDSIAAAVGSASGLNAAEAGMVTGYVTPGVLGVMKRQMLNGAVLDNSDGIGQMLLGEVVDASAGGAVASVDHSVPKSAPRQTQTTSAANAASVGTGSAAMAAAALDNESDASWLFRWALPALLLGGLILAGVQNCVPKTESTAALARAQQIAEVQTEVDGLKDQVVTLTSERDEALSDRETAVGEIDRLSGELESANAMASDTSALDAANAEITSLKEQLAQPADTSELDAANAEIASLKEQLAQPADTSALDAANAEITSLKEQLAQPVDTSALDAANAEIASLKDQLTASSDSGALNAEILSLKDQLANVPAPADNSAEIMGLKQSVDDSELKIAQLESELGTVRDSRAGLEASMAEMNAQNINAEARIAELKDKLLNVAGAKNRMEGEIAAAADDEAAAQSKLAVMQANLNRAIDDATAKRKELVASTTGMMALKSDIESESEKRMALNSRLQNAISFSKNRGRQLASTQEQLESEQQKRSALSSRLENAISFSKSRGQQLAATQEQLDSEHQKRLALSTRLENAIAFSKSRGQQLEENNAELAKVAKGRSAAIKTVTDLARKLRASESAGDALKMELAASQEAIDVERDKRKVLSTRLRNAIAFSKSRGQESSATLAKVTKGRSAAIKTVTDLAGKLRASESAGGALEMKLAESQTQIDVEREKRMALDDRLRNAIAFSKERGAQLEALAGEKLDLEARVSAADAAMQAEKDRVSSVSASLADELAAAGIGNVTVQPVEDGQAVGITMGSSDLYEVGSASLSPQGNEMLAKVGSIVGNYDEWQIDVEGHTDGQPIGSVLQKTYASNWELSTARAAAAVRYLQFNTGIPAEKMSVRGFGEYKPLATNDTSEGREANRRIELILRTPK